MTVVNLTPKNPHHWIPSTSITYGKIIIEHDDGTEYTVMNTYTGAAAVNYTISANFKRTATDRLGSFQVKLSNAEGAWLNYFDGGEVVRIYADSTDATTLVFRGRIDNVKYGVNTSNGYFININGRDKPELIDMSISGKHFNADAADSIGVILYDYYDDITLVYWNGTEWIDGTFDDSSGTAGTYVWDGTATNFPTTVINTAYQHKKGWQVIKDICELTGLDCYLNYNETLSRWELRLFTEVQIENVNALVSYGTNLISMNEYGKENTDIVNRAIVYGKKDGDNVLLIKSENDATSQTDLWVKDQVFNQPELFTMDEVQEKANYEVSSGVSSVEAGGRCKVMYSHQFNPGDIIYISLPYCNITGQYKVREIEVSFGYPFTANITFSKKKDTVSSIFLPYIDYNALAVPMDNINGMKDSFNMYFKDSTDPIASTSNITIKQDVEQGRAYLGTVGGATTGYIVSSTITVDYDITECLIRKYESQTTQGTQFYVSNTGGNTWEEFQSWGDNETHQFDVADNRLKFRMIANKISTSASTPVYESVAMLYK